MQIRLIPGTRRDSHEYPRPHVFHEIKMNQLGLVRLSRETEERSGHKQPSLRIPTRILACTLYRSRMFVFGE
jgi:hypothetical protein